MTHITRVSGFCRWRLRRSGDCGDLRSSVTQRSLARAGVFLGLRLASLFLLREGKHYVIISCTAKTREARVLRSGGPAGEIAQVRIDEMDQKPNFNYAFNGGEAPAPGFRLQQAQREEDEVDLMEIIRVLAHHAWIIVLAALIGAVLVGVAVKLFVPARYTANATIYVFSTEGETSTQVINVADKMTTDFQIIGTTSTTLNLVIEELGLDTTVEELKKENTIRVTNPTDSHMLRISVTNEDPEVAAQLSNTLASVMCDQIADIMKSDRPQFVEPASTGVKTSPALKRDAILGGLVFAMAVVAFLLIRYFNNDTITTEEDVTRYLGLTTLSSVPLERNMYKRS